MELEIKKHSKLYLRRNLRSILPQRKKCSRMSGMNKYTAFEMFTGGTYPPQFMPCFNFCVKCFFEGNGKIIASDVFVRYVLSYFWKQDVKFRNLIKKIYRYIIIFFPEKVEKRINYFIKESYISDELYLLIDFAECLPRQKITRKNFLDYLRKTKFSDCKDGFVEPINSYDYTNFYLNYFDE